MRRGVPRDRRRRSRDRSRSRRQSPTPRPRLARAAGQRPGAVRRLRRRRVRRRERALRPRRGRADLPAPRRRDDASSPATPRARARSSCSTRAHAGDLAGDRPALLRRRASSPSSADECSAREITTRDVDRGDAPHYLLKEITEAPESFRKTLRGKIVDRDGRFDVRLARDSCPTRCCARAARRARSAACVVIGQGTARSRARASAMLLRRRLPDNPLAVEAMLATEFSGFDLRDDMRDTLVVAISRSRARRPTRTAPSTSPARVARRSSRS